MDKSAQRERRNLQRQNRLRAKEKLKCTYEENDFSRGFSVVFDSPGKLVNRSGNIVEEASLNHSKELFPSAVNNLSAEIPASSSFMDGDHNPEENVIDPGSDLESDEWDHESTDAFEDDGASSINDDDDIIDNDASSDGFKLSWGGTTNRSGSNDSSSHTNSSHKGCVLIVYL